MKFLKVLMVAAAAAFAATAPAHAELEIDITRGHLNPMPIAVPDFIGTQAQEVGVGKQVAEVIRANLERSSLFRITDRAAQEAFKKRALPPRSRRSRPTTPKPSASRSGSRTRPG